MPEDATGPTAAELVGQLAEPERLAVVAALALGASSTGEVERMAGLDGRTVGAAARRLRRAGLVSTVDDRLVLRAELFKRAARAAAEAEPDEFAGEPDADTLRAFVRRGRLLDMPTSPARRRLLLGHIARSTFEPAVRYAEPEVNARLGRWHADHAMLRRFLVDERVMCREAGRYWLA